MNRCWWSLACALAIGLLAAPAYSQPYPSRPVRLISPIPPGGAPDLIARAVGHRLSVGLGQPVVVENKAGAGALLSITSMVKGSAGTQDTQPARISRTGTMGRTPEWAVRVDYNQPWPSRSNKSRIAWIQVGWSLTQGHWKRFSPPA